MHHHRSGRSSECGFTLIEALVALTILVILAGMGSASFSWFNQTTRIRAAAFDLVADLDFARSEAVKRNADVIVAPSALGTATSWNNGWTVTFTDALGVTTVLRRRGAVGGQVAFETPEPGALTYDGGGRVSFVNTNPFQICPPSRGSLSGRTIRVDASGLSRSTKSTCD
jgi:type IV fimbrial biogenesis protein FimT